MSYALCLFMQYTWSINLADLFCVAAHQQNGSGRKWLHMVKSSNGNIFHVTGHLCGEFTSHRNSWQARAWTNDIFFNNNLGKIFDLEKIFEKGIDSVMISPECTQISGIYSQNSRILRKSIFKSMVWYLANVGANQSYISDNQIHWKQAPFITSL